MELKLDLELELLNLKEEIKKLKEKVEKLESESQPRMVNPVYRYDPKQGKVINIHEKEETK